MLSLVQAGGKIRISVSGISFKIIMVVIGTYSKKCILQWYLYTVQLKYKFYEIIFDLAICDIL